MENLTDKQKAYRDSIIPRKKGQRVKKYMERLPKLPENIINQGPNETFLEEKMKYLKNCLFWLNEYSEGRQNKERLSYTIKAIESHCAEIRNKILK